MFFIRYRNVLLPNHSYTSRPAADTALAAMLADPNLDGNPKNYAVVYRCVG